MRFVKFGNVWMKARKAAPVVRRWVREVYVMARTYQTVSGEAVEYEVHAEGFEGRHWKLARGFDTRTEAREVAIKARWTGMEVSHWVVV